MMDLYRIDSARTEKNQNTFKVDKLELALKTF